MKLKLGIGLGISYRLKKKKFSVKYKKKTKKTLIYLTVSFTVDLLSLTVARSFLLPLSLPFALWSHAQRVGTGTKGQKQRSSAIITTFAFVPTHWAWDHRAINFWFYFSKTGKSDNGSNHYHFCLPLPFGLRAKGCQLLPLIGKKQGKQR